jgi:hypothetical protein
MGGTEMGDLPMNRTKAALVIVTGIALAACQRTPEQNAADANAQALEKRIAALEQQAPPSTSAPADPASMNLAPEPVAPGYVERSTPAAPSRKPATTTRRVARAPRVTSAPAPRVAAEPVERVGPAAEPIEPMESMAGTGDPGPRRETLVIPGGTELRVVLETGLSSETSRDGERVVARVERATSQDGRVVLPGGTVLRGRVVRAESAGRVRGVSHLTVDFDRIVVRGREHPLSATSITVDGPDDTKRDVAVIAGSTAAGAVIGGIMKKGAKKGAVVGAATGAGAVLVTKGAPIEMPAGSRWTVRVTNTVRLD